MSIKRGIDYKLNVKPVCVNLVHKHAYEGPCRTGIGEQLTEEYDRKVSDETFNKMKGELKSIYNEGINLLEPVHIEWNDDFIFRQEYYNEIEKEIDKTDIFLVSGGLSQYPASQLALKYNKPVGVEGCCMSTDTTAYLRSIGKEGYGYIDFQDADYNFKLLRTKKAISKTKVLFIFKGDMVSKGVVSNIRNIEEFTVNLGVEFKYMNSEDLLNEVNFLNENEVFKAERITDDLIDNAEFCYMERKDVLKSVKFYVTVRKMLDRFECNAFTIPCFEICSTRRLDKEKYVFCLAHSLLKEDGIPSACEADLNVLMAINVLINLTNSSPHMGNLHPVPDSLRPDGLKSYDNLVSIFHAVPTRYMKRRDNKAMPYGIQSFTHSNWGASLRYNYDNDKGSDITFLRFGPTGTRMFAVKANIVADIGYKEIGCGTGFYAQVSNVKDFFRKECEFGHHYAWVYGDIREQLKDLGEVLGIEVVTA